MTQYAPKHQEWHDKLPEPGCQCAPAWKDRGMVDAECLYHQIIEVIEVLREYDWIVEPIGENSPIDVAARLSVEKYSSIESPLILDIVKDVFGELGIK